MRRKLTEQTITTLETVCKVLCVPYILSIPLIGQVFDLFHVPINPTNVFCILIYLALPTSVILKFSNQGLDCLRKRNDKIHEEEKAKQKMIEEKLKIETEEEEKRLKKHAEKAEAERIRTQSQIWVIG